MVRCQSNESSHDYQSAGERVIYKFVVHVYDKPFWQVIQPQMWTIKTSKHVKFVVY